MLTLNMNFSSGDLIDEITNHSENGTSAYSDIIIQEVAAHLNHFGVYGSEWQRSSMEKCTIIEYPFDENGQPLDSVYWTVDRIVANHMGTHTVTISC